MFQVETCYLLYTTYSKGGVDVPQKDCQGGSFVFLVLQKCLSARMVISNFKEITCPQMGKKLKKVLQIIFRLKMTQLMQTKNWETWKQ